MSLIDTRRAQMFPVLDAAQMETARRFASGQPKTFLAGEILYDVGQRDVPAWLLLSGSIELGRHDGLGHQSRSRWRRLGSLRATSASWLGVVRSQRRARDLRAAWRFRSTLLICAPW